MSAVVTPSLWCKKVNPESQDLGLNNISREPKQMSKSQRIVLDSNLISDAPSNPTYPMDYSMGTLRALHATQPYTYTRTASLVATPSGTMTYSVEPEVIRPVEDVYSDHAMGKCILPVRSTQFLPLPRSFVSPGNSPGWQFSKAGRQRVAKEDNILQVKSDDTREDSIIIFANKHVKHLRFEGHCRLENLASSPNDKPTNSSQDKVVKTETRFFRPFISDEIQKPNAVKRIKCELHTRYPPPVEKKAGLEYFGLERAYNGLLADEVTAADLQDEKSSPTQHRHPKHPFQSQNPQHPSHQLPFARYPLIPNIPHRTPSCSASSSGYGSTASGGESSSSCPSSPENSSAGQTKNSNKTVNYTYESFFVSDGRSKQNKNSKPKKINDLRFSCNECGKHYATSSNLSRHKQTHRSLDSESAKHCPDCGKVYVSMPALSMHLLTHELRHRCHICNKAFSRPWLLQGHLRSHSGERPYGCAHCGRAFADRSNLRAHMQTHSDRSKYSCTGCNACFTLKSRLVKHNETDCRTHPVNPPEVVRLEAKTQIKRESIHN